MSYSYQYTNKISQFGIVSCSLKIHDPEGILPEYIFPVILNETDLSEEILINIAETKIAELPQ
jgi:hypothetical protein